MNYRELCSQVLLRLNAGSDGRAFLAVRDAINNALHTIARVRDFPELFVLDTTHAMTVSSQKSYHIVDDLALVHPKDIYSIRYMDESLSRKLRYVAPQELDDKIPYTEMYTTGRPSWYTRRGRYIELFRIPDAAKPLYIFHSQWPATLVNDTDEPEIQELDDVIVTLATDIAQAVLQNLVINWRERAAALLVGAIREDITQPDSGYIAKPFSPRPVTVPGEYWLNPFVRRNP